MRAIGSMGERGSNVAFVTLATPFLKVYARPSKFAFFATSFAILVLLLQLLAVYGSENLSAVLVPISIALAVLLAVLLALFIRAAFTASSLFEAAAYNTSPAAPPRMLVVRGVADEASLALAAGRAGASLSYFFSKLSIGPVFIILVLLWSFGEVSGSRVLSTIANDWAYFCGIVFAMSLLLPNFFTAALGREFVVESSLHDMTAESVPDSLDATATVVTLEARTESILSRGPLRHSIYDHPECVTTIVKWLKDGLTGL